MREDRGPLLGELEEEDAPERPPLAAPKHVSRNTNDGEQPADRRADPTVDPLECVRVAAETFHVFWGTFGGI